MEKLQSIEHGSLIRSSAILLACTAAFCQDENFKASNFYDGNGGFVQNRYIAVKNGKLSKVSDKPEKDVKYVDLTGFVTPGIIEPYYTSSFQTESAETESAPEKQPVSQYVSKRELQNLARSGITTIHVVPNSDSVIPGYSAIVKTDGTVLTDKKFLVVNMGWDAMRGNYSPRGGFRQGFARRPSTRMGSLKEIRDFFSKNDFKDKQVIFVSVWEVDLLNTFEVCEQFGVKPIVCGAKELFKLPDESLAGRTFIFETSFGIGSGDESDRPVTQSVLKNLKDCAWAFTGGNSFLDSVRDKYVFACRYHERSNLLRRMFEQPAKIIGVSSLSEGNDADFVVFSEQPLSPTSRVNRVFVNGKQVHSE